jgi:cytochrome P450
MSVSSESISGAGSAQQNGASGGSPSGLPEASFAESTKVVVAGLLPTVARGLFKPRRAMSKRLTAMNADGKTVEVLSDIKRKHPGQGARLFGGRMVVLWGADAIREVMDNSADLYASDAGAKKKGMCHFQPDALTISRGEEWRDRRAFTEHVLATGERVHPDGDRYLATVADEFSRMRIRGTLEWDRWERLFDHLTLRVVLGDKARGDQDLTELLSKLMCEANRIVAGEAESSDTYHELHARMEWYLRDPEPGSLVARFADAPQSDKTRVVHQIPHWLFAMRDTLGANTYRALAAIAADERVEERVREEMEGRDLTSAADVDGMRYLEGCFQEAMRLWPSTPLLAREATRDTVLAGERIEEGTQVMLLNAFNHRDPDGVADGDLLKPERWETDQRDYRFNHLASGSQWCPGEPLVLLLGKGVLAQMLSGWDLTVVEPELPAGSREPLPHMLDFYSTKFVVRRKK